MTDQEILGAAMAYADKHSGEGGTTNYNQLENKPQIAGTTLSGNKSLADLGIASASDLAAKQDEISVGSYLTMNNNVLNGSPYKNSEQHDYVQRFSYDGQIHSLTIPYTGKYKLQVWGASGGGANEGSSRGGYGGYSEGFAELNVNDVLYICVGGKGNPSSGSTAGAAGYNGGGTGDNRSMGNIVRGAGGGATHIAKVTGLLNELSSNLSDIFIVAGGGGGAGFYSGSYYGIGGSGGGFQGATGYSRDGNSGVGGTQLAGGSGYGAGSFGQGGNFTSGHTYGGSGGGAGLYGGGASENNGGAGGGSGYINPNLTDACMYGYEVTESDVPAYKTVSVDTYNDLPVDKVAKRGDGYAVISFYDDGSDDLVKKGELDTELNAIKDGQSIDSFADVETALAGVETALRNKQNALTAGDYIEIDGNEISVNPVVPNENATYEFKTKDASGSDATVTLIKKSGDTVISSTDYRYESVMGNKYITVDDLFCFGYSTTFTSGSNWGYKLLAASADHAVDYTRDWGYNNIVDYTETFTSIDHSGENLVLKAQMDTALAGKQDALTFDDTPTDGSNNPVKSNGIYDALTNKADTDMVAADFNAGTSYTAGNYCIYEGKFYKFKNNHSGAWSAADVDEIKIAGELSALNSGLTNVNSEVDTIKNGIVYGFHIDGSVSDPSNRVTYLRDAIGKTPAYMDYNEGSFNYGSWEDTFFMPRPCMVERSGNVAYYLNPNDYTKKADGTASDIADTAYAGNAMMEWGRDGKKIWMKIEPDSGDTNSCNVYIADHRVDSTFHDWSFHNCNGVSVDHFYTPIYNGSAVSDGTNNVLRSLSGQYISHTQNASAEITMAGRNNAGSAEIWGTEVYADIVLINMLLTLIGKSTNTQGVFGRGLDDGGENAMKAYVTGALNDKGLFFGYNDGSHGVKVFGMENWWACQWRRYRGHIMVDGVQKVKLTYGTEDGSTVAGYNLTGDNYISVGATPTGTSGQYCDKYEFLPNGAFPKDADNTKATASTHYCDGLWFNNSGARVPFRGGTSNGGSLDGAWYVSLDDDASYAGWTVGAALSCKPLA